MDVLGVDADTELMSSLGSKAFEGYVKKLDLLDLGMIRGGRLV